MLVTKEGIQYTSLAVEDLKAGLLERKDNQIMALEIMACLLGIDKTKKKEREIIKVITTKLPPPFAT